MGSELQTFTPVVRRWFENTFHAPTAVQAHGWPVIAGGGHALLLAPTGSGKTLAAFLTGIDRLTRLPADAPPGVRVLYVSPLKALVYDVDRNLRSPLVGIQRTAELSGTPLRPIRVDVRTGDTPQIDRRRQARSPGEILVTTPESLFLLLGSAARETLRTVETVIIDEVHALAPTKRGSHLALSLERLADLTEKDPQRLGLSATVRPRDEVARFLGGTGRAVEIVDASAPPFLDLEIVVPTEDMEAPLPPPAPPTTPEEDDYEGPVLGALSSRSYMRQDSNERGIWPTIYPELVRLIYANRSTIIFVNSRGLCERLSQKLNELAGEELVRSHHGSVSHAQRADMEEALKAGELRAIVATSSLELGIDMGAVDLVVMVESPGSVARGLQRAGRAGHQVGAVSQARLFPKFRGDLLECAVIGQRMQRGELEALQVPQNPLDVLAQQLVAMCVDTPRTAGDIERLVKRAYPYQTLTPNLLHATLDMLSGRYPSSDFDDLRPRLSWDRAKDLLAPRRGAAMLSRLNAGTIPDRGNYIVTAGEGGPRVGELDEEMVFESRAGDTIILGASTWRIEQITRDRVVVSPAPGEPGRLPFWRGEGPGRPLELGRALGAFTRQVAELAPEARAAFVQAHSPLDAKAAKNLAAYLQEQIEQTQAVPTDRTIVVERFRDELGDWRLCILSPFGSRVHAPWAMALQALLEREGSVELQVMYTDDGIVLRLADGESLPPLEHLLPDPEEVEELVTQQVAETALFAALFRENAARALLLPRRSPDRRNPLWAQRIRARNLLAVVRRYPDFPILLETYRQALRDIFDMPALLEILRAIRARTIRVHAVETPSASPFARSLVFAYVAAYIYDQDSPLAERRAQALTLDRNLLAELLGQDELRELIDADILRELEAQLQGLAEDRRARDPNELHDLLRRVGDLTEEELRRRCAEDPAPWLAELQQARRAVPLRLANEERWVAAEEAGLYRDALGVMPPAGLPHRVLEPVPQALPQLIKRYARTRGPFLTHDLAERYNLSVVHLTPLLQALEQQGDLVRGEIRPGGRELEWCHAEILRRLKRRTLAKLRNEVAAVEPRTLGLFLPQWQGLERPGQGLPALEEAVAHLEGLALPWSELQRTILPARVRDFSPQMLDMLCAQGSVVWVGRGALGPRDGRVALYRRDRAALLLAPPHEGSSEWSSTHQAILDHLQNRGASFTLMLQQAAGNVPAAELEAALWDLVWAGLITNDTMQPLQHLGRGPSRSSGRPGRGRPPLAGGRWSLVSELLDPNLSPTERVHAQAASLLHRYGVLTRDAVLFEEIPGGFSPLYRVLRAMEESGRVRRGYFVEGLGGAQFALPGAVDRLRAARPQPDAQPSAPVTTWVLSAVDPANPYGSIVPWPATSTGEEGRARRVPGARVVLAQGELALYLAVGGSKLYTFGEHPQEVWSAAFRALLSLPRTHHRRRPVIQEIDGVPVRESSHYEPMRADGFVEDYKGLTLPL